MRLYSNFLPMKVVKGKPSSKKIKKEKKENYVPVQPMIKYVTSTTAGSTGRYRMPLVSVTRRNNRGK